MKHVAYLAVASALVLAGCVGTFTSEAPASESGAGDSSDGEPSPGNLTIEVVDLKAEWTPPASIEVTATVNGTLTRNGQPVDGGSVRGVGTLVAQRWCYGLCSQTDAFYGRRDVIDVRTRPDGTFSIQAGPFDYSPYPPPVAQPYCTGAWFEVWAVAGRNDTVPYAEDRTEIQWICTQSYP